MQATETKQGWIDVALGRNAVRFEERPDGAILVTPTEPLAPYPDRLTDRLVHWANVAPERTFVAQRGPDGSWREISYAQALSNARAIATALIARNLSAERPVAIVSGNDLDHAMLALGAMFAGVPFAPISPSYSLMSADFSKLRYIMDKLTPGLVFASDQAMFGKAVAASVPESVERVWSKSGNGGTLFSGLLATPAGPEADAAPRPPPGQIQSPSSCLPQAPPAIRRASSPPSACCRPIR
jgi:feruloyl-CoA synthase